MPDPNQNSIALPAAADPMAQLRSMMGDAEGVRPTVYRDSRGLLTVGIGHKVVPADGLRLGDTIGSDRMNALFQQDATPALNAAQSQAASIGMDDPTFIPALASVNFQLGTNWPQNFPKTWAAMAAGDYPTAAMEAGRSQRMQQTPKRVRAFQDALLALPSSSDGSEEDEEPEEDNNNDNDAK